MEENKEQKFDYKSLSLKKQYLWKLCKQILKDLKNGECTEEQIEEVVASTEPRKHGYFREEDYVTADQAMKILRLGQNRNKFFDLIQTYKIESQTFNGVKIGYRRSEIYELDNRLGQLNLRKRNRKLK